MPGIRKAAAAAALVVLAVGCAGPARPATTGERPVGFGPPGAGRALVHVHEFPASGWRLVPPTGRPKLSWRQAAQSRWLHGFFDPDRPPEIKLADLSNTFRGPTRPVLVWVAVDPEHPVVEVGGPDFGPAETRDSGRCPMYVAVDAASGRGYGAWQTCDPPYRG